jgi:hypothetical protein
MEMADDDDGPDLPPSMISEAALGEAEGFGSCSKERASISAPNCKVETIDGDDEYPIICANVRGIDRMDVDADDELEAKLESGDHSGSDSAGRTAGSSARDGEAEEDDRRDRRRADGGDPARIPPADVRRPAPTTTLSGAHRFPGMYPPDDGDCRDVEGYGGAYAAADVPLAVPVTATATGRGGAQRREDENVDGDDDRPVDVFVASRLEPPWFERRRTRRCLVVSSIALLGSAIAHVVAAAVRTRRTPAFDPPPPPVGVDPTARGGARLRGRFRLRRRRLVQR